MKKINLLFLLLLFPLLSFGQFIGLGGQYANGSDGQFVANLAYPVFHKKNSLNSFISSGVEYTTYGGAKLSGLNIKPIQFSTFLSEDLFNKKPYTILLGVDGGYLFNFPKGRKNGIVFTPNVYVDYKSFFVKAGYDFDVSNGHNQFFVRAGICFGLGTIKMFPNTKIW